MKPDLKQFLIDNNVFDRFCTNLKNNPEGVIQDFDEFVEDQKIMRNQSDGITFGFEWEETPEDEGFYFWNKIDTLWQKYYYRCMQNG